MTKKELVKLSDSTIKEILEKCSGELWLPESKDTGVIFLPKELREKYGITALSVRVEGNKLVVERGLK